MKQYLTILTLLLVASLSHSQLSSGYYKWAGELSGPDYDYVKLTIEIIDDTSFRQIEETGFKQDLNNKDIIWEKRSSSGVIMKDEKFYVLLQEGKSDWQLAKFKDDNLILYGYIKETSGSERKLKGIVLKKTAI